MSTQRISWLRAKVEPDVLKKLNERSDLKGLAQVITLLLVIIGLGILTYYSFKSQPLWLSLPIFYVYCTVYSFTWLTAAIHELSHNTVFKTKWLNEFFSIIFACLSWSDYVFFNLSHAQHHAFTTHHGLDEEVIQPIKLPWYLVLQKFSFDFSKFYTKDILVSVPAIFRRALGIISKGREEQLIGGSETKRNRLIRGARIVVLFQITVIILAFLLKEWLLLLLITFAPFFAQGLNFLLSYTQHTGLKADASDFRQNCRSIKLNPIFAFLYWQMNYHVEHHMYAGVPFYNLKKLSEIINSQLPEKKGLFNSWIEINAVLKKQKENPDFYIEVILPK